MRALFIFPLLALASCATPNESSSENAQRQLARALEGRVAGTPVNCVSTSRLGGPQIIDNRTILYRESGRRVWRNDLPDDCPFLRDDRILVVELHGSSMCRNDTFSVLDRGGLRIPLGKCRLGQFTPYDRPRR